MPRLRSFMSVVLYAVLASQAGCQLDWDDKTVTDEAGIGTEGMDSGGVQPVSGGSTGAANGGSSGVSNGDTTGGLTGGIANGESSGATTGPVCSVEVCNGQDEDCDTIVDEGCLPIDDCAALPCKNGGICTDGNGTFTCACAPGFMGATCEVNVDNCSPNPCKNGGTCADGADSFTCSCQVGYQGELCEIVNNDCDPNPCRNGGSCKDVTGGGFMCSCAAGYTGAQCETNIDECASKPCQNGGVCKDGINMFTCTCPAGFMGAKCETNINECTANPCQNGGVCTDGINSRTCKCPAGYMGASCEISSGDCYAPGLRIREIAAYQVVKIPLFSNGTWITSRNAPIVQKKKTLVRVFFDTFTGNTLSATRAVLTLDNGGLVKSLNADLSPSASSTDAVMGSSFNFNVEGADIGAATKLSVVLVDPACGAARGALADTRFPASGMQDLGAQLIKKHRVVVVPVIVNGLTPDTSPQQLENMRNDMVAHYPIYDVDISLRPAGAITSTTTVTAQQGGWSEALMAVCSARSADAPAADVYYYGLMTPASTFSAYCSGGCVLGLASLLTSASASRQCGIGVGWLAAGRENYAATTFTHETGHLHGRSHVACNGEAGTDPNYPYTTPPASIGSWGWDSRTGALVDPAKIKDFMSYCSPVWASDYTYNALATRAAVVNTQASPQLPDAFTWHAMWLYENGKAEWSTVTSEYTPSDDIATVDVLSADGQVVDTIEVAQGHLDHSADIMLFLPEPRDDWATLILPGGRRINFSEVAPARTLQ